ncbi:hypothetical protein E0I26_04090 [Flavobacterium rhamnosiphilum]|uniref:Uncharacterized protein n=1 Tax=Flavobacterium rhamnosiphilum TaxID=2541724 RepID=A0A4R5FB84_9FLAO|nr:hypothetical protein [Flavobacterium rhamnosiphilum]TDE45876.1 hypothetical protein E0I26_04090 [Flavobacterium rhamnosiphilum]
MLKESKRVKVKTQRSKSVIKNKRTSNPNQTTLINFNSSISIINDVTNNDDFDDIELTKILDNSGVKVENDKTETDDIYAQFATLFKNPDTIMIPTKVKSLIERDLPKGILDNIHGREKTKENRKVAVELCLLFLSQLSSTHRNILNGSNPEGWKSLRAEYLRQLLRIDEKTYQHVKDALKYEYKIGSILEDRFYIIGKHSYEYRLGSEFRSKGFVPYKLQTGVVQTLFKKSCVRKLKKAQDNIICVNLLELYKYVVLPTENEINIEAKMLVKLGHTNKKGKTLIFNNKKGRDFYPNPDKLVFVEDSLKAYKYLTKNGLLIPRPGNEKSGKRVVDSFTLMPSWIRKLVKINGQPIAEADYSCLHPNIAMSLYGGNAQYLTHKNLETELGIDEKTVKIEHLSFFNKEVSQMQQSPLFKYYQKYEPAMLDAIIKEKNESEYKHKITSRRLFAKEVEIMTEVVSRLNEEGIFVGYVYDALFFDPVHSQKVVEVMDEVAVDLGAFTKVKIEE